MPDTAQWEVKSHRIKSNSLLTLFHLEPEPRTSYVVNNILLPKYGWALPKYGPDEYSFRQTLRASRTTDRGFGIKTDRTNQTIRVFFDASMIAAKHQSWVRTVEARVGLADLNPQPYWDIKSLVLNASTKLLNIVYVEVETSKTQETELFRIVSGLVLQGFDIDSFLDAVEDDAVRIDFDARTGHNHGQKFRVQRDRLAELWRYSDPLIE